MNKRALILIISLVAVVVVVVLACSVFAVSEVRTVTTADFELTDQQNAAILEACGIKKGGSVFSINEEAVIANIEAAVPEIKVVTIERSFPGTVSINCTARRPFICMPVSDGSYALLDRELKVISLSDKRPEAGYIDVEGYVLESASAGGFAVAEWLSSVIKGGENNYFMDVKLSYFIDSISYVSGNDPYIDLLTNTGAHMIIYDSGDIAFMFNNIYNVYAGVLQGLQGYEEGDIYSGYFYPVAEGQNDVRIAWAAEFSV